MVKKCSSSRPFPERRSLAVPEAAGGPLCRGCWRRNSCVSEPLTVDEVPRHVTLTAAASGSKPDGAQRHRQRHRRTCGTCGTFVWPRRVADGSPGGSIAGKRRIRAAWLPWFAHPSAAPRADCSRVHVASRRSESSSEPDRGPRDRPAGGRSASRGTPAGARRSGPGKPLSRPTAASGRVTARATARATASHGVRYRGQKRSMKNFPPSAMDETW